MGELWRRLWYLLNRSCFERELREEMEAHRAELTSTRGAGPRFGNTLRLSEEARDAWGWAWFDHLVQDSSFACRLLVRTPVFTLTAVAVLAVGVGLNLAAFQVIDRVALSWLPIRSPETLIRLYRSSPRGSSTSFSYPSFDFYRRHASSLTSSIGLVYDAVTLGDDEAHRVDAEFVTTNLFSDLGETPLAGRLLDRQDESADAPAVIVLSERIWRSRFGADPAIAGRALRVNGQPFTVAGVVADTFVGVEHRFASVWMPIAQHRIAFPGSTMLEDWKGNPVRFYARVRPGAAPSAVEAELKPVVRDLAASRPDDLWKDEWLSVHPAGRYVSFAEAGAGMALIAALVGLVLVAACMNLGLLVLARTLGREREFAIRLSVGATRGRIVRQLLTEHLLLGALGAAAACFVATQISTAVMSTIGTSGLRPHFNVRALLVAAALAVVSSLIFGFAPAWQSMRPAAERRMRLRSVLVGLQVAAASALLIVSGLLVRGVTRIVRVPLGFEYRQTLMADPGLSSYGITPGAAQGYWQSVEARVRQLPGVRNVALTSLPPFGNRVTVNREKTIFYHVTPAFFDTMRIPLKHGRLFLDGEADVAIVNETLARRHWPGEDPIGKIYDGRTVIGVSGDARTVRISDGAATECYMPIRPELLAGAVMVVRLDGAPARAAGTIRAVARGGDERLMPSVVLLEDALEEKLEAPRQVALIASGLGFCALLLAVTGLAGMVAFTVSQRLREIGVRVALGARPAHIVRAISRQFTRPIVVGAIAGSALAALAGTVLSREMFGVSQLDPLAHGGSLLLFALVAAAAALPSVRRALRVDPVQMLRHE